MAQTSQYLRSNFKHEKSHNPWVRDMRQYPRSRICSWGLAGEETLVTEMLEIVMEPFVVGFKTTF